MVVRGEELHLLITIICLLIVIAGTPLMNGARGKDPGQDIVVYMEYINNVNYNWGSQMATYGGMDESQDPEHHGWSCNFVNNYYNRGPLRQPG